MRSQLPPGAKNAAAFAGMVLGTGGIGFAFFLMVRPIAAYILLLEATRKGAMIEWWGIAAGFIGAIIGPPIGVIVGILLINKLLHYSGSLVFGILGCVLGEALFLALLFFTPLSSGNGWLVSIGFFLAPPLFGMLGFHLGSKKRRRFTSG